jgi:hypothetical protein
VGFSLLQGVFRSNRPPIAPFHPTHGETIMTTTRTPRKSRKAAETVLPTPETAVPLAEEVVETPTSPASDTNAAHDQPTSPAQAESPAPPKEIVLPCPKCSGAKVVVRNGRDVPCYRCKNDFTSPAKGVLDFRDLERNRRYDIAGSERRPGPGPKWKFLVRAVLDGKPLTKHVAFAKVTDVFRVAGEDEKIEVVMPGEVAPANRIFLGSEKLGRTLEVEVLEVVDVGPPAPPF